MRQVGILCAAALVAVQENVEKLEGDHKNAKILAGRYTSPLVLHAIAISGKKNYYYFFFLGSIALMCNIWKLVFSFS
jgi:threonine aldolase